MELSDQQLIAEAIETNHVGVRKDRTLDRYRDHLVHYSHYLASVFGLSFYTARRKHVRMFMNHLAKPGGPKPHESRLQCAWCKTRGYPDGRSGPGWSPSYRKSYLAAIKFLYLHFLAEEDLPDLTRPRWSSRRRCRSSSANRTAGATRSTASPPASLRTPTAAPGRPSRSTRRNCLSTSFQRSSSTATSPRPAATTPRRNPSGRERRCWGCG